MRLATGPSARTTALLMLTSCQLLLVAEQRRSPDAGVRRDGGRAVAGDGAAPEDARPVENDAGSACAEALCEDFADSNLDQRWTVRSNVPATLAVDSTGVPPPGLLVSVPPGASNESASFLARTFDFSGRGRVTFTADVQIELRGGVADLVRIEYPYPERWVNVSLIDGLLQLEACGDCTRSRLEPSPPAGEATFRHLTLTIDLEANAATARIDDGVTASLPLAPAAHPPVVTVAIGLPFVDAPASSAGIRARFDNVRVRLE